MTTDNITIGILAHVDAGKTTLSESILYRTGTIRTHGRVDHGDAFLDTDAMEKKRGITIYSKIARLAVEGQPYTLLDTPGHADFSPEMERTLRVLDYAIVVVSAADGVTEQVRTIWKLLHHYHVPAFIVVNKIDQLEQTGDPEGVAERLMTGLREELGKGLVRFDGRGVCADNEEEIAVLDENIMERYLNGEPCVTEDVCAQLVREEKLVPVYYAAALYDRGTDDLLRGMHSFMKPRYTAQDAQKPFGALVYKISRAEDGTRLTWLKITSGRLSVRDSVKEIRRRSLTDLSGAEAFSGSASGTPGIPGSAPGMSRASSIPEGTPNASSISGGAYDAGDIADFPVAENEEESASQSTEEKISGLRLYSGEKYTAVTSASAGSIVAAAGLTFTRMGDGLGIEKAQRQELLSPIETRSVTAQDPYGKKVDDYTLLQALSRIEEEEPMLHVSRREHTGEIEVQIMGQVQTEILQNILLERDGLRASFGPGRIVYKETVRRAVEGVGHFEPLRHYAEVHLLLEPGEPGSGIVLDNQCPPDTLERNWQNLIMSCLSEKTFKGVLTGAELTDVKITLIGAKASRKHTSGGDFRQAAYRAVRQGLMRAENILLEPVLSFRAQIPQEFVGRLMTDVSAMAGTVDPPVFSEEGAEMTGRVPASTYSGYPQMLTGYTAGRGHISASLDGYAPCHNAREVLDASTYDPDLDRWNPSYSVFCSHGAGTPVAWPDVRAHMHIDIGWTASPDDPVVYHTQDFYTFTPENQEEQESTLLTDENKETAPSHSRRREKALDFAQRQEKFTAQEKELREIFERTYGPVKENLRHPDNVRGDAEGAESAEKSAGNGGAQERGGDPKYRKDKGRGQTQRSYLLVDGYNIIFAWRELQELAQTDIKAARDRLLDILSNYAGYSDDTVIVVFDAYKVAHGAGEVFRYHNIDVVYTKEAETADLYIEKTAHTLSRSNRVTVATSDAVEQVIIYGSGAYRLSARGLLERIMYAEQQMRETYGL